MRSRGLLLVLLGASRSSLAQQDSPRAPASAESAAAAAGGVAEEGAARPERGGGEAELEDYGATAEVAAPAREPTRHAIEAAEIARVPGTRGDALRAIEVFPGVARTGMSEGTPILRGAAGSESLVALDGAPVPFLYHFGGLTSFLHPRLVDRVELVPGNFSARYGRVSGGLVEVRSRVPDTDRLRAGADVNLIDASAWVEAPLGERGAVLGAVRRSNIDLVFDAFVPDDAFAVVAAPVYVDYQLAAALRPVSGLRARVLAYGSRDTLRLLLSDPPDSDPLLVGRVDADMQFHRVALAVEADPDPGLAASATLTAGTVDQSLELGPVAQSFRGPELFGRGELSAELLPEVRFTAGTDLQAQFLDGRYRGPAPGVTEGNPQAGAPLSAQRFVSLRDDAMEVLRGGTYVEFGLRPAPALRLVPGLRVDHLGDLGRTVVDPRLTARWEVGTTTTLKGGVGRYSQAPEWWQALPAIGSEDLRVPYALHASLGAEQLVSDAASLSVEGFAKALDDLVVTRPAGPPHLDNAGEGRVIGAELLARGAWSPGGRAQLAYTLSRSERRDRAGGYRPFDRDQPHVLSAVGSQELGRGFSVGARFRLVSGNPGTPVVGGVYDARSGAYLPRFGPTGSARDPLFYQLDLRAEKAFRFGPLAMVAYLELMNATAAENPEGRAYSFDYRESAPVRGMPILPNLGLRGEL